MQNLTRKEKLMFLSGLALISASITFIDWWRRGQIGTGEALLAGLAAIVFLFWVPVSIAYYLIGRFGKQQVIRELPIWLILFYCGYRVWGAAVALAVARRLPSYAKGSRRSPYI